MWRRTTATQLVSNNFQAKVFSRHIYLASPQGITGTMLARAIFFTQMAHDQVCFIHYTTLISVLTIPFRRGFPSGGDDGHFWTYRLAQSFYSDQKCELPCGASGEQCINSSFFLALHLLPHLSDYS